MTHSAKFKYPLVNKQFEDYNNRSNQSLLLQSQPSTLTLLNHGHFHI